MPSLWYEILRATIAGVVSLVVSVAVVLLMRHKKLIADRDAASRIERLVAYRTLWQLTEPLSWYINAEMTAETAKELLSKLGHWYFDNGRGLFMSTLVAVIFEELLRTLGEFDAHSTSAGDIAADLRAALAHEIGGRDLPLLVRHRYEDYLERKYAESEDIRHALEHSKKRDRPVVGGTFPDLTKPSM